MPRYHFQELLKLGVSLTLLSQKEDRPVNKQEKM